MRRDDQAILMGAGGLLLFGFWQRDAITDVVVNGDSVSNVVNRGSRLTIAPAGDDGVVAIAPDTLATMAAVVVGRDVTTDAYALARMIRSEGSDAGVWRAHVALNDLASLGWDSLTSLFTYSTNASAKGFFGAQYTAAAAAPPLADDSRLASVRRYATTRDPYQGDLAISESAIADHANGIDPSGGAVKFVDVGSFKVQSGTGSYADLVARWAGEGLSPFTPPGAPDGFVVFRRA